jgi:hypothetical protein
MTIVAIARNPLKVQGLLAMATFIGIIMESTEYL